MITELVAALQHIDAEITAEDVADVLWLALEMKKKSVEGSGGANELLSQEKASTPPARPVPELPVQTSETQNQSISSGLYPGSSPVSNGKGRPIGTLPFRSPAGTALPGSRDIARILRSFRRRIPLPGKFVLNEEATAKRIAEEGLWVPVLDHASTRWLEIALVVDKGASMIIWRQAILELHRLLAHHGAFRDVRLWELDTNDTGKVYLYAGTGAGIQNRQTRSERELIDTSGRRLILLVTDCVSPAWHSGIVAKTLREWGYYNTVTLVQVLPQRMWSRTALGMIASVRLHASTPGSPNKQLLVRATHYRGDEDKEPQQHIAIPIITLEPKPLTAWSRAIARAEDVWIPGFELAIPSPSAKKPERNGYSLYEKAVSIPLPPAERVQRFRADASSPARRLAGLLAIVPITLPIIRLVQQAMFHEPRQVHVAEVFLCGLFEVISPNSNTLDPDDVQYDFVDGAREILLNSIPPNDSSRVLAEITAFITSKFAHPLDFSALLANPLGTEGVVIDKENRPFALMGAKALRRFGGEYVALANWLEEESSKGEEQEQIQSEGTVSSEQVVLGGRVVDDSAKMMAQKTVDSSGIAKDVTEIAESVGVEEVDMDDTIAGYIHEVGIRESIDEKNLVEEDKSKGRRLALIVGTDQTESLLPPLRHAITDAQEIARVLQQTCGFELFDSSLLLGGKATSNAVKSAILDISRKSSENDTILFYFNGHIQQVYNKDRSAHKIYLVTADFRQDEVELDPYSHVSMNWLREILFENIDIGGVLVILDCSYAGDILAVSDHTLVEPRRQLQDYLEIPDAEVKKRHSGPYVVLAAAAYDQNAKEADEHSKMTRLLLKVLRGEEPEAMGEDGQITLNHLLEYINREMPDDYKPVISHTNLLSQNYVLATYPEPAARQYLGLSQGLAPVRPTSYIPFPRDAFFQPRTGEFEHLETLLLPSTRTQTLPYSIVVGVIGMGGIGKTQLAIEFAHRYRERFPGGIFWMPATGYTLFDWQSLFSELAFNADYLPPGDDTADPENNRRRAQYLCRYLAQHADSLLILDNVENPELVKSVLPTLAGSDVRCAILYTSRITSAPQEVRLYSVECLTENAALRLLLETTRPDVWKAIKVRQQSEEVNAARQICKRVGYLPIALAAMRILLAQDVQVTLVFLAEALLLGKLTSLKEMLFKIFHLSWERIHDEEARRIFLFACSFPEEKPIPLMSLGLATGLNEQASLRKACLQLQAVSLFEQISGEKVRLHPLMREFGQDLLAAENDRETMPGTQDPLSNLNMPAKEDEIHLGQGFEIAKSDGEQGKKIDKFEDRVELSKSLREFRYIPNPYTTGTPVHDSKMFYGREEDMFFLQDNLTRNVKSVIVLYGQRRSGKTTLLLQLINTSALGEHIPVLLDMQGLSYNISVHKLLYEMAHTIARAMKRKQIQISEPKQGDFGANPTDAFNVFLDNVEEQISERKLILMIDEFEVLEEQVLKGRLEPEIFDYLRYILQYRQNINFLFSGTHKITEYTKWYRSVFFNIARHYRLSRISPSGAEALIQQPITSYLEYEPLTVAKIRQLTADQPYLIHQMCRVIVDYCNIRRKTYVTIDDVNIVLSEIMQTMHFHFDWLWDQISPEERIVLSVMVKGGNDEGEWLTLHEIVGIYEQNHIPFKRDHLLSALRTLFEADIIELDKYRDDPVLESSSFRISAGLVRRWLLRDRPLELVREEFGN